jgi:ankyrin repeat protein
MPAYIIQILPQHHTLKLPYSAPKHFPVYSSSPLPKSPYIDNFTPAVVAMKRCGSAPSITTLVNPPSSIPSPLCKAAACGNLAVVQNVTEDFGRTPLHLAAIYGRTDMAMELIRLSHTDLELMDEFGKTPLHLACEHGHTQTVHKLIKLGAQVDGKGAVMRTPLHTASEEGHTEVVCELLRSGAQVDALDDSGNTPLHWASEGGHRETVQELIAQKADVKLRTHLGLTPLHLAAKKGHTETCRVLVRLGASVNAQCASGTPLHLAAERGHCDTVEELVMVCEGGGGKKEKNKSHFLLFR